MNRRIIALSVASLLALGPAATAATAQAHPRQAPDSSVVEWDAVGTRAFTAAALSPAEGHMIFAYVAVAVYDSVMAIDRDHEPFSVDIGVHHGASAPAAVAAAAHRVLTHYLPAQSATILDPAYASSLASIPDGPAKLAGEQLGLRVGRCRHRRAR